MDMHTLAILDKKISVTKLPDGDHPGRRACQERPAAFGHFTVGQLIEILNDVQHNPFKEKHLFRYNNQKFIVRIYDPSVSEAEDDASRPPQ